MYACVCRGITEAEVRDAGGAGVLGASDLIAVLGLDDEACCGQCVDRVDDFVSLAIEGATVALSPSNRGICAAAAVS